MAGTRLDVLELQEAVRVGFTVGDAANCARQLTNSPANVLVPQRFAEEARELVSDSGIRVEILDEVAIRDLGMGLLLGVSQGSVEKPRLIVMRHEPPHASSNEVLALVGKGVTFDSGGISLKPADGMEQMKGDMAGGAAVVCAMRAIGKLEIPTRVIGIVPATENMPGGRATKPGDVLYAMNGKTIEVDNTDAEGRVTLADAVLYAKNIGLQRLVDIATLTGAIRTSLGNVRMGLFANNQSWADEVLRAGDDTGERMWQLPMDDDYKELNRSNVADIKNTGGPSAGSITAAHFIGEFAESTPWVHLDIAAVSMFDKEKGIYVNGATGIPVRSVSYTHLTLPTSDLV